MLSLAAVGFISAGLFFTMYAYTFQSLTAKKIPGVLRYFAYAYYSLAGALFIWGIASHLGDQALLAQSVIAGNVLLFLSSFFLINLFFAQNKNKKVLLRAWVVLSMLFIWWRVTYFPPQPYMTDGLLVFNTQPPVAIIISLLFLLLWLPTNIKVAYLVADRLKLKGAVFIYSWIYILATIAALVFIAAKTTLIIILSFTAVVICFAMLIVSNMLIEKTAK